MRLYDALTLVVCAVSLLGCSGDPVRDLPDLLGKTETQVHAKLGKPTYTNEHTLEHGKTLPEMYIEIHNTYDPVDPSITGVVIRENRWEASGHTKVVLYHLVNGKWVALHAFRFDDGVMF